MIKHRSGQNAPTDQEIIDAFQKIHDVIPEGQIKSITEARDGIAGLLGFCLGLFNAWQQLQLAVTMEASQQDLATSLETLEAAKEDLADSLETAKTETAVAIQALNGDLATKQKIHDNTVVGLQEELEDLKVAKTKLATDFEAQKTTYETGHAAIITAHQAQLTDLQIQIKEAEGKLAKTQKAFDTLKAKLN